MTGFLLFLAFALLFAPLVETLWDPLWVRVAASTDGPSRRLRFLSIRMSGALGVSGLLSFGLLWIVYHAPRSHPMLPGIIADCLGHGFEHGPGLFTIAFLTLSTLGLGLVLVALFHPLPCFPPGLRRPDLETYLETRGVRAAVEILPGEVPSCWSEITPHPRILLLGEIEALLPSEQLEALLDHEAGHLVAGDHRHRIWARAYRRLLFFFAGARAVFDAFVHEQERRADDQVLEWDPSRRASLRQALRALATQEFPHAGSPLTGSPPLGALGQAAWSAKQRIARLGGGPEEAPAGVGFRVWPFLGLGLAVLVASSDPGACTLHCLIDSLP